MLSAVIKSQCIIYQPLWDTFASKGGLDNYASIRGRAQACSGPEPEAPSSFSTARGLRFPGFLPVFSLAALLPESGLRAGFLSHLHEESPREKEEEKQ